MNIPDEPGIDRSGIDRVLRDAGGTWRAGQPPAPVPDVARIQAGRFRSRRWVPALAAAGVAVIAATIAIVADGSADHNTAPAATTDAAAPSAAPSATPTASPSAGQPTGAGQAALVVRDGDLVEMTGEVIAAPGRPVVYCGPHLESAVGYPPGRAPAPSCPAGLAVTVTGVDLDRLGTPGTRKGVRFGQATLRGVWRSGSVEVSEQSAPRPAPSPVDDLPAQPPCRAPAGGWRPGSAAANDSNAVTDNAAVDFVEAHPRRFGGIWIAWPGGRPTGSGPADFRLPQVLVVQVVEGDLAQTHRELARRYDGNLCVERAKYSTATRKRVQASAQALSERPANGISGTQGGMGNRGVGVSLLVVTERLHAEFARIGLDLLDLRPAVRPVR